MKVYNITIEDYYTVEWTIVIHENLVCSIESITYSIPVTRSKTITTLDECYEQILQILANDLQQLQDFKMFIKKLDTNRKNIKKIYRKGRL